MPPEHLSDEDTELARLLYSMGRLPADQLSPLLERIRAQRTLDPSASLSGLLVSAGLVSHVELEQIREDSTETVLDSGQRRALQQAYEARWAPGVTVAGYRIEEDLGRGGMGVVSRAVHLASGRQVALKGLLHQDPEAAARFAREVEAMVAVDGHPNVARVYDAGQVNGRAYFAIELLPGGDLAQRLRPGSPLPAKEAARVVSQLARGLEHVHARGILHRDLKPQNVLFDEQSTPKLVDFGLVRVQGAKTLTQTGQVMGTPAYMAPEQALGVTELDARTDVYGLGAILYACLTGRPPFVGQLADVLTLVISEEPPRPSTLAPAVDPQLEAICLRALAKRPEDRYPSAAALAEALEAWGRPRSGPSSAPRGLGLALGALGLGLVAGVAVGLALGAARTPAPATAAPPQPAPPPPPVAPAQPPDADPPARPTKSGPAQTRRVSPDQLEAWQYAMIPIDDSVSALALITGVYSDRGTLKVDVSIVGVPLEPQPVPPEGFLCDALGVGAQVVVLTTGLPDGAQSVVHRRVGPVALVEHVGGDRVWLPVHLLLLTGDPIDPGPDGEAEVQLAVSPYDGYLYPAVAVASDQDSGLLRVVFLDGQSGWIPAEALAPLPSEGDRVFYRTEDGFQPARFARLLGPSVVELTVEGEGRLQLGLSEIRVDPEDR